MHPRQQHILDLVAVAAGEVRVSDLAARVGVTPATVRRDLEALQQRGLVERTHGGAALSASGRIEFHFHRREELRGDAKRAIARAAAARIHPGMTISLDTGTTTLEVARALRTAHDLRVLTTSLAAAAVLHSCAGICLILLGGQARVREPDLCGELVEENLGRFHVDLAVLGADGITADGLWTSDPALARSSLAMIRGADRCLLVADSSKFGRPSFYRFADWAAIGGVITDAGLDPAALPWTAALPGVTAVPPG